MTLIENSDGGVTLTKPFAWTVGTGLIGAGVYVGLTIASLTTAVQAQGVQISEGKVERSQVEYRVRNLETNAAGIEVQFRNLSSALEEVKASQRETNTLLRQLVRPQQ
jgi:hypothetical protein